MDPTVADKLKEIQELADLAREKRRELEDQVSKLSRERFFYLQQAEERKKQIHELREGIKQLPPIHVKDLGSTIISAVYGPGAKTLRDICEITGLKNKAVSQCLQILVKRGYIKRILPEGRKRGAGYRAVEPWKVKPWPYRSNQVAEPTPTSPLDPSRCTRLSDKYVPPDSSQSGKKFKVSASQSAVKESP